MYRFHVDRSDAVVVDERVGQGDNLSAVGRIGADLLVAGHAGVEAKLSSRVVARTKRTAKEDLTVFQGEQGVGM